MKGKDMHKKVMILLGIILQLGLFSCETEDSILSVDNDKIIDITIENENSPRIVKENGSFSFGLKGDDFSGTTRETVQFNTENIVIAINLENHREGSCDIKIKSDYNEELFAKEITSNIIYSEVIELDDYPEQMILEFDDFTGTLKMAIAEDDDWIF